MWKTRGGAKGALAPLECGDSSSLWPMWKTQREARGGAGAFGVRRFIAALADVENAERGERCAGAFGVRRFIAALADVENAERGKRCAVRCARGPY